MTAEANEGRPKGRDMRLRILACRHVYHGKNQRGDEYDIYEIDAAKPDGTAIKEKLRSFATLPLGQEIEVTVTPFHSERHGRSFTLQQKGSRAASVQGQVNELRQAVERQAELVRSLVKRIEVLETRAGPVPDGNEATLDRQFGAEAPW